MTVHQKMNTDFREHPKVTEWKRNSIFTSSVGKESTCNAGDPGERNTQKEEGRENENKG